MTADIAAPDRFEAAADRLHEEAIAASGLDDFGAGGYREPLAILLASIDADSPMTREGRGRVYNDLLETLVARLFAVKACADAPGAPIKAPIMIMGIPRTGTTALHKLMSVDPQFQGLNRWLAEFPMPRPPRESWADNPCFRETSQRLASRYAVAPDMKKIHLEVADEVDECLQVLRQEFTSIRFGSRQRLPTYDQWLAQADQRPSYRWYARVLSMIGGVDDRRWLLKNPSHLLHLPALLDAFPDAAIIQTHRDLLSATPSFASLLVKARRVYEGEAVNPKEVAERVLDLWGRGASQALGQRRSIGRAVIDVDHAAFNAAPLETVAEIYSALGLVLTPQVEAAMRARLAADPERNHGTHHYDLETYGLTETRIRDAFGSYAEVFA